MAEQLGELRNALAVANKEQEATLTMHEATIGKHTCVTQPPPCSAWANPLSLFLIRAFAHKLWSGCLSLRLFRKC